VRDATRHDTKSSRASLERHRNSTRVFELSLRLEKPFHPDHLRTGVSREPRPKDELEQASRNRTKDEALSVYDFGTVRHKIAGEEPSESPHRPWDGFASRTLLRLRPQCIGWWPCFLLTPIFRACARRSSSNQLRGQRTVDVVRSTSSAGDNTALLRCCLMRRPGFRFKVVWNAGHNHSRLEQQMSLD